jgi:formate dehydrogenase subunit gamma
MKANDIQCVQDLIRRHRGTEGALLPLLHAIQDEIGHIPEEAVNEIAKGLNLSRAEVHGVVTYYHHLRTTPPGKHTLRICRAEACRACGAEALLIAAENHLSCKPHETTANGAITLEPVYCLGLCASSPSIQIDEKPHARMTEEKLKALLAQLENAP